MVVEITQELIVQILECVILPILIAAGGLKKALNEGKVVDWFLFFKTIFIGLVAGGFLSVMLSDVLLAIVSTTVITWVFDTLLNALLNKTKRTASVAPVVKPE